jgi:hypothetical protein
MQYIIKRITRDDLPCVMYFVMNGETVQSVWRSYAEASDTARRLNRDITKKKINNRFHLNVITLSRDIKI